MNLIRCGVVLLACALLAGPARSAAPPFDVHTKRYLTPDPWFPITRTQEVYRGFDFTGGLPEAIPAEPYAAGPAAARFPGVLAYIVPRFADGAARQFLLVRSTRPTDAASLPLRYETGYFHQPSLSPSRRYVACRDGFVVGDWLEYAPIVVDIEGRRWVKVMTWATYWRVFWKNDNSQIAFVMGYTERREISDGPEAWGLDGPSETLLSVFDVDHTKNTLVCPAAPGRGPEAPCYPAWDGDRPLFSAYPHGTLDGQSLPPPPDVWEADPAGSGAQIAVHGAFHPSPSPDKRWIAFVGRRGPKEEHTSGPEGHDWVWLYDRRSGRKYPLSPLEHVAQGPPFPDLLWSGDSRWLVSCELVEPPAYPGYPHHTRVRVLDLRAAGLAGAVPKKAPGPDSLALKEIARFPAAGEDPFGRFERVIPEFRPLRVARDNRSLLCVLSHQVADSVPLPDGQPVLSRGFDSSVNALDLMTGKSEEICHVGENWGVDFVEGPMVMPALSSGKARPLSKGQRPR